MDRQERSIIYVVTRCSYDSYYIIGVFADEDEACRCRDKHLGEEIKEIEDSRADGDEETEEADDIRVERWYLNYGPMERRTYYVASIGLDGEVRGLYVHRCEIASPGDEVLDEPWIEELGAGAYSWESEDAALELARKKLAEAKERGNE